MSRLECSMCFVTVTETDVMFRTLKGYSASLNTHQERTRELVVRQVEPAICSEKLFTIENIFQESTATVKCISTVTGRFGF